MALTITLRQLFSVTRLLLIAVAMAVALGVNAAPSERGALAPSAPVRLDYELPEVLPVSGTFTIRLRLSTPVSAGRLHFEVVRSEGLSIVEGADRHFDLQDATQPFAHELTVMLGTETPRYVLVLVSVDGPIGSLSRSYRIDLTADNAVPVPSNKSLKLLPATQPH